MKRIYVILDASKKNHNIGFSRRKFALIEDFEYMQMPVTKENIRAVEEGLKIMKRLLR